MTVDLTILAAVFLPTAMCLVTIAHASRAVRVPAVISRKARN